MCVFMCFDWSSLFVSHLRDIMFAAVFAVVLSAILAFSVAKKPASIFTAEDALCCPWSW